MNAVWRPSKLAFCCLVAGSLVGCSLDYATPASGDNLGAADLWASLSLVGEATRYVLPGGTAELAVRYTSDEGGAVVGVPVQFALLASDAESYEQPDAGTQPPGASLTPHVPLTDEEGVARVLLTVGSTAGKFTVRARAEGTAPVYIEVIVGAAPESTLSVHVTYEGARDVVARSATVVESMSCDQARSANQYGMQVRVQEKPEDALEFSLAYGLPYAVLAWGRDATGAELASGCVEITPDQSRGDHEVTVRLEDSLLRLMGHHALSFDFSLSVPAARIASVARAQGEGLAPEASEHPRAHVFLDAVEAVLRARAQDMKAAQVADKRSDGTLDLAALEALLEEHGASVQEAASALGERVASLGERLTADASYGVGASPNVPMAVTLDSFTARSQDGRPSVAFHMLPGAMLPTVSVLAAYDDARAVVDFTTLRVHLGLGSYARSLLEARASSSPTWLEDEFADVAGCAWAKTWIESALPEECDPACAESVCGEALGSMLDKVRTAWSALDVDHPAITLRGVLAARDRDRDGWVDDLGPSVLLGNWGKAQDADESEEVSAELRTPSQENVITL